MVANRSIAGKPGAHRIVTLLLAGATGLLVARTALSLALVPPWQQPDEPTHVALAEFERSRHAPPDRAADPGREAEILRSMADYDWWDHRGPGWRFPIPFPQTFALSSRAAVAVEGTEPPGYFRVAGAVLSALPPRTVAEDLYILRGMSALLGVLTLWVVFLGARESTGPAGGAIVALLLALHPHVVHVTTAAAADAAVNLLGACVWWQSVVALRTRARLRLALVWLPAIAAAAADRMGLPLLLVALLVSAVAITPAFRPQGARTSAALTIMAALAAAAAGVALWVFRTFGDTYGSQRVFASLVPVEGAMTWDRLVRFNGQLLESWWYSLGWGRYTAPDWWMAVAVAITLAAAIGLGRRMLGRSGVTMPSRTLIALAAASIAIQLVAVHWAYFRLAQGAQGRYLFPLLAPSLVLLWLGLEAWIPPGRRMDAAAALIVLVGVLDASAWILVAIPAYYASF